MYFTPNFSSKGQPQSPSTQDNFYHVLEGPTPSRGNSPERSTAPGKEEENEYDEPVQPNQLASSLVENHLMILLIKAHLYQRCQHNPTLCRRSCLTVRGLTYYLLLPTTSPVEDKAIVSDPSYQLSSPSRLPTASRPTAQSNQESKKGAWNDAHAFSQDSKNAQEDDYDQPATITVKNKKLNSN